MNPSVPESFIAAEIRKDPASAAAEYLAEFRDDISSFVLPELVDAAIVKGCQVIAPQGQPCVAFIDVSGGVHDSHTAAVAFKDELSGAAVLACAREVKSADTEAVVAEFAALLKSYGVSTAYGSVCARAAQSSIAGKKVGAGYHRLVVGDHLALDRNRAAIGLLLSAAIRSRRGVVRSV
jgi:hypothetical protein